MDYEQEIAALVAGKIDQIEVTKDHFFAFNKVWRQADLRKQIVGEARHDGTVIYRFQAEAK
ncbi:hypothetical protein HU830_06460 [Lactobacillus sp. DCY120]|uniref:Uncharacterized protein n=1 Tax=Bombilactobacillus apium TaxID=2675299 RepID=A0A850RBV8_9LACO|nr:hypothetical protein [Bombilactobacillus apium]NVY96796.1 hypothetical protein [Bombilactobacillus apium]